MRNKGGGEGGGGGGESRVRGGKRGGGEGEGGRGKEARGGRGGRGGMITAVNPTERARNTDGLGNFYDNSPQAARGKEGDTAPWVTNLRCFQRNDRKKNENGADWAWATRQSTFGQRAEGENALIEEKNQKKKMTTRDGVIIVPS